MTPNQELRQIMTEHGLSYAKVGELLTVSTATVKSWLRPPTAPGHRNMRPQLLELLKLKLGIQ